jgi:hypothetical protein
MANLTCAELLAYPGETLLDKFQAQGQEARTSAPAAAPVRSTRRSPATMPRRVDIRRFPGRDRAERVMHYLRAHFPRADSWSEASLQAMSAELLRTADIVE